jgi:hypothetical protein
MAVMQLLLLIEESFGLWLPESGLTRENLRDVRSLAGVVATHLAAGEPPVSRSSFLSGAPRRRDTNSFLSGAPRRRDN